MINTLHLACCEASRIMLTLVWMWLAIIGWDREPVDQSSVSYIQLNKHSLLMFKPQVSRWTRAHYLKTVHLKTGYLCNAIEGSIPCALRHPPNPSLHPRVKQDCLRVDNLEAGLNRNQTWMMNSSCAQWPLSQGTCPKSMLVIRVSLLQCSPWYVRQQDLSVAGGSLTNN